MRRVDACLFGFLMFVMGTLPVMAQENEAEALLDRMAERIHCSNGIWIQYSAQSDEGSSEGVIRLKGGKFLLKSPGMTTWFDGRTQWTYLEANDEVNISEPTSEELQSFSPFVWIGLYKQGYTLQLEPSGKRASVIVMKAVDPDTDLQQVRLYVEHIELFPIEIRMRRKDSSEDILIKVKECKMDENYPDSIFVFNKKDYPTAEVIDLR